MKMVAENEMAGDPGPDAYFDGSPTDTVLVGIGEELRSAYGGMTSADQPEHLVGLARKLDTLIAADGDER